MDDGGRAAAIDVGTNTVLLVIAEGGADAPVALVERAKITRLGQGVDRTKRIDPAALARTLECLADYGDVIRRHGVHRVATVCTSAARDAQNGAEFLTRAEEALGFPLTIIDGGREAELTFRGALSGLLVAGSVFVFDVGGGSTEIVTGRAQKRGVTMEASVSLDIGSVRLTERYVRSDPPSQNEISALRAAIRNTLTGAPKPPAQATAVAVAGTATTLAAVSRRLDSYDSAKVHGHHLSREVVEQLAADLAAMPLAERRSVSGLEPKRADVIVAGAYIVAEIMQFTGLSDVTVSDRGVRWGLIHELLTAQNG